jgi:hypothetical protein
MMHTLYEIQRAFVEQHGFPQRRREEGDPDQVVPVPGSVPDGRYRMLIDGEWLTVAVRDGFMHFGSEEQAREPKRVPERPAPLPKSDGVVRRVSNGEPFVFDLASSADPKRSQDSLPRVRRLLGEALALAAEVLPHASYRKQLEDYLYAVPLVCESGVWKAKDSLAEKPPAEAIPMIPMLLWCPNCGERHIDAGEFATKPHHTHACQKCGMVWRPAVAYTVGVQFLPGYKNDRSA